MIHADDDGGASQASLATVTSLETRAIGARLFAASAVGIGVGALVGGLVFGMLKPEMTATSFVRISEPVELVALAGGASLTTPITQDNQENYVAGEVAFLTGDGFARAVGDKMGKSEPADFEVTQNGTTTVVSIGSTAESSSEAIRTVDMVLDLYRQRLAQRTDQRLRSILPALSQWESDAPSRREDIQELRQRIELQSAPSNTLVVLQPPTADAPATHRWVIGALVGALLLGILAPAILWAIRRRAGRLSSAAEVMNIVDGVLVPAVSLRQPRRRSWGESQTSLARTFWAQLPSSASRRVVVVIGASSSSGTATVAGLLHFAASENGAVETITLIERDVEPLVLASGDTALIIDAGAVGGSRLQPQAVRSATDLVMVSRLGVDTVLQAQAIRSVTATVSTPLLAVFTYRGWKAPWSRNNEVKAQRGSAEPDQPPVTAGV
ncbi:MAG: hypothetical protein ABWY45_03875 [Mycobacterium sp.]